MFLVFVYNSTQIHSVHLNFTDFPTLDYSGYFNSNSSPSKTLIRSLTKLEPGYLEIG